MSNSSEHLANNQKQLDADGTMVGVSRQALDETLIELAQQAEQLMQAQTNSAFFRCCALSGEVPAKGSEPFPPQQQKDAIANNIGKLK
jgi:hypothetical protein